MDAVKCVNVKFDCKSVKMFTHERCTHQAKLAEFT